MKRPHAWEWLGITAAREQTLHCQSACTRLSNKHLWKICRVLHGVSHCESLRGLTESLYSRGLDHSKSSKMRINYHKGAKAGGEGLSAFTCTELVSHWSGGWPGKNGQKSQRWVRPRGSDVAHVWPNDFWSNHIFYPPWTHSFRSYWHSYLSSTQASFCLRASKLVIASARNVLPTSPPCG